MSPETPADPPYFAEPFAVRNVHGRPFNSQTTSSHECAPPWARAGVLPESGLVHMRGQRQQRRPLESHLTLQEANSKVQNKDTSNMEHSSPTSTSKRRHSGSSGRVPWPKRLRTSSEPRHEPQYPPNRQPVLWNDCQADGKPGEVPCPTEPNSLVLELHQTPAAFRGDLQKEPPQLFSNPLYIVGNYVRGYESPAKTGVAFNEPLLATPRYPFESPPSSTDSEASEGSSEIVPSVETQYSPQISSIARRYIYDRSRGPSFSPITTPGTSPEPDVNSSVAIDPSIQEACEPIIQDACALDDLPEVQLYNSDPLPTTPITQESQTIPPRTENMGFQLAHATEQTTNDMDGPQSSSAEATTDDTPSMNVDSSAETLNTTAPLSTETAEPSASHPIPNLRLGLLTLRFANKPAFVDLIQRLESSSIHQTRTYDATTSNNVAQCEALLPNAQVEATPSHDSTEDQKFVEEVKAVLKAQGKWKTLNVARRSARRIGQLLEIAKPPNTTEALYLTGDETTEQLKCGNLFPGPIITKDQQPLPLQTTTEFLNEFYDDKAKVWIQDPSILLARNVPHAREITIGQLKRRFFQGPSQGPNIPWNCLEMATHVEDGLRPPFLNNEDCRLLTKLKLPSSDESASRRGYEPGWKEVEKWALLAQGGALTEPHQDSHGYGTYITVNQGAMGFGWLSNPTPTERAAWREKPATYTGGRWRYVVLRPGETVYFPTGTVHFVFRLASVGDTLAFGGHVLRCSQIVRWVETMLEEMTGPDITNEYLTVSAPGYLDRVEKFVKQALETGEVERWGGRQSIEKFLELKGLFMRGG